jgi:voltage-gated potassium channel
MQTEPKPTRQESNAYELFILVLTVLSLVFMVGLVLPRLDPATESLLQTYDNAICVVFLIDFGLRLKRASSKRGYLVGGGGWLDLLGSIPSFGGALRFTALFRLARLSRLTRITRLLRGQKKGQLVKDVLDNRSQYAVLVTVTLAMIVLMVASILELQFEVGAPGANITTGGTALWWGIVTITTVGYGDTFPVTAAGRVTGFFVMFAGVGIIGALASILASVLIPPPKESPAGVETGTLTRELAAIRETLVALREATVLQEGDGESDHR